MILKDVSLSLPAENILYDEVLLNLCEENQSQEILRFWESSVYFVVLGRISKAEEDVHWINVKKDNIPVLRRASGGGTVLQGKGCLNYSLILSKKNNPTLNDIHKSYEFILNRIISALKNIEVSTQYFPISDIALTSNQKKISGNAQKRGKNFILHHGTILYNFDLTLIEKYLTMPKSIQDYRKSRSHRSFVENIFKDAQQIKDQIIKEFNIKDSQNRLSDQEEKLLMKNISKVSFVL